MMHLISGVVLLISLLLYMQIAKRYNILDIPNERSSHNKAVIRGGGIVFYVAVLIFSIIKGFPYPYFFIGLTFLAIISFIDDIFTLSSAIRLPFHLITVLLALYEVFSFEFPLFYFVPILILGVGFINSYNFMDGINGITVLYSLAVFLILFIISILESINEKELIPIVIISLLIFGYYNVRKRARIFAGDIGSMVLAITIFFVSVSYINMLKAPVLLLVILIYATDSGLTLLYRLYKREKITLPHRHHLYQKLVDFCHWSHLKVS